MGAARLAVALNRGRRGRGAEREQGRHFAYDDGTEGSDRGGNDQNAGLLLPGWQDALISAVAAVNPNVVVVLNTGDAVYMPWLASVRSVLEMWYPGVAGGVATADVLVGNVTPSGKLPITFPDGSAARPRFPTDDPGCNPAAIVIPNNSTGTGANDGNCPLYPGVFMRNPPQGQHTHRTVNMQANSVFQGYRWYDVHGKAASFPFGHGLSYTQFTYSNLTVTPRGQAMTVSFKVTNSGSVKGDEVPQVYVGSPSLAAGADGRPCPRRVRASLAPSGPDEACDHPRRAARVPSSGASPTTRG